MEFTEVTKTSFRLQERADWYRINAFLVELGEAGKKLDLDKSELIHIGGTSIFYHAYDVLGSVVVPNYRGTHDMDIISFRPGSVQRVLDSLKADDNSHVADYLVAGSFLPHKRKITVEFENKENPGALSAFDVDVFESPKGAIHFNDRIITPDKVVLDPCEELELRSFNPLRGKGLVAVPSFRDAFLMKMDVADYSRMGLRQKDRIDALVILRCCSANNYSFSNLLHAIEDSSSVASVSRKLNALEVLYAKPEREFSIMGESNPLLPTKDEISTALEEIRDFRTRSGGLYIQPQT